jgi:predicted O-methyltransferase YrrM
MSSYTKGKLNFLESANKTGKAHMLLPELDFDLLLILIQQLVPKGSLGLEVGTFIGKTTAGLSQLGYPMITIEQNPNYARQAYHHFEQLQLTDKITVLEG